MALTPVPYAKILRENFQLTRESRFLIVAFSPNSRPDQVVWLTNPSYSPNSCRSLIGVAGSGRTCGQDALLDIEFSIDQGESVAILGRSGSGKTTLLNILAGLDRPTEGKIQVGDCELSSASRTDLDRYRSQMVGVVFQQFRLIKHKTAFQNVVLPLVLAGTAEKVREERVRECLRLVGLENRLDHRPTELSGGEQQRVAVARAICNRPQLLLADEPTGNLDSANAVQIMELLELARREASATLVLITHDEELASKYMDRTIRLADGRVQPERGQ